MDDMPEPGRVPGEKEKPKIMHKEKIKLFNEMHPGFFAQEHIRSITSGEVFEEMILSLEEYDPAVYHKEFDDTVSFGFYDGSMDGLKSIVAQVEQGWLDFYGDGDSVYCGSVDGRVVSFCLVEDMGIHEIGGKMRKIGGPGCVGTLSAYRNRGIGLTMVNHVTQILKKQGYDYSYIHYTGVPEWYGKLGYRPFLRWDRDGIID